VRAKRDKKSEQFSPMIGVYLLVVYEAHNPDAAAGNEVYEMGFNQLDQIARIMVGCW